MTRAPPLPDAFRSALAARKREGCVVLVAGRVSGRLVDDLSARLLGDAAAGDRARLFGLLDRTVGRARTRLALAPGGADCRVVTTAGSRTAAGTGPADGRAAAGWGDAAGSGPDSRPTPTGAGRDWSGDAAGRAAGPAGVAGRSGDAGSGDPAPVTAHLAVERVDGVRRFVDALPAAVEDVAAERGSLGAAELRVCVDSVLPLVTAGAVDHRSFVATMRETVRRRRGMAHFVLPAPADGEVAAALSPLFDVVVSLRTRNGPEQRWHLPDAGHRTGWVRYPEAVGEAGYRGRRATAARTGQRS